LLAAAKAAARKLDLALAAALVGKERAEGADRAAGHLIKALEAERDNLNSRLATILAQLEATDSEGGKLLAAADAKRSELEARLAAALAAKIAAENANSDSLTKAQQQRILLAQANSELREEQAKSAASLRQVEALNQQTAALRKQLNALQALLDASAARDVENEVQIATLGANLNMALAQTAAEQKRRAELEEAERKRLELEAKNLKAQAKDLEKFKSEFFGQMRDLLANREGVRIVGDRFVFSSEVLFSAGSVDLSDEGKAQIAKVAGLIKDVSGKIPPEIDWILRVDGHTDNVPLGGSGKYHDNWELSQGRALSVVRYMIDFLDIRSERLAATGFGEFQPVNTDDTPEARAQNRRIELKFTER